MLLEVSSEGRQKQIVLSFGESEMSDVYFSAGDDDLKTYEADTKDPLRHFTRQVTKDPSSAYFNFGDEIVYSSLDTNSQLAEYPSRLKY
jgi:hypothetical protein